MRVLLLSIKPKYAQKIRVGDKTIELRRIAPKMDGPIIVLLYESSPVKAITGFAVIEDVTKSNPEDIWERFRLDVHVSKEEFDLYYEGTNAACALHIRYEAGFAKPMSLAEMRDSDILNHPPQSYRYLLLSDFGSRSDLQKQVRDSCVFSS